jgi:GT2 family glycosyltransferase
MLYIIVPVFNRLDKTIQLISSLNKQIYKEFTLIIVNDGSTDGTNEYLLKYHPNVIVIEGNGSLFWGGAINKGLEYVKQKSNNDDLIAFANNDVSFDQSSIVKLIYQIRVTKDLALFHSLIISQNGLCFTSGSKILSWPFFWTKHPFRGLKPEAVANETPAKINLATARFIMFKKEVLNIVSEINTKEFIHYLGDCDFSLQLEKSGIFTYIVPNSWCYIDNTSTGENAGNLSGFKHFLRSLSSIKSSNNLFLRYRFGKLHCPSLYYPFYCLAVTLQVFIINLIIRKSYN